MRGTPLAVAVALLGASLQACSCGAVPGKPRDAAGPPPAAGPDLSRVWRVEGTTEAGVDRLVRGAGVDAIKGDLEQIIRELNRVTALAHGSATSDDGVGPPVLLLREVRAGIAHVEVVDGEYLTQRMGTTGAHYYLTAATFSLTEAPGVRAVDFIFEEGDHAAPGVYTRESFKDVELRRE